MHEQLAMLVAPAGAIELLPHAVALPLLQKVSTGQAVHPAAVCDVYPGRHAHPDNKDEVPGGANVLAGHGMRPPAAVNADVFADDELVAEPPGQTKPASHSWHPTTVAPPVKADIAVSVNA